MESPTTLKARLYEAINARHYEAGFGLLADEFEWVEPEHGLLGGHHRGFDEVRATIERQLEVFDEFTIEPEEFHEHGQHVAVAIRQRARGGVSASRSRRRASPPAGRRSLPRTWRWHRGRDR